MTQHDVLTLSTGTYVIQIRASNFVSTGSYTLGLECLVPPSPVDAALVCGSLAPGAIDSATEVDQLTFRGQANQQVTLTLTSNWLPSCATPRTSLFLVTGDR